MYEHRGCVFQGDFPADFGLISRGGSNTMREGGRVEGILREIQGGFKGDSRGVKGIRFILGVIAALICGTPPSARQ